MKGISPMIAVVLLIAFVVGVGGVLSVWFTTLTSTQTGTVSNDAGDLTKCASTTLIVDEVRYLGDATSPTVNITYSSGGTESLKNITITVLGGGGSSSTQVFYNGSTESFRSGASNSTSLNTSGGAVIPPEIVRINGICQGQRVISASCSAGENCMKPG